MADRDRLDDYSLSKFIAEEIAEQIIKGELQPGVKIVEGFYAEKYGLSRSPIREALYLLTIDGLVERIPRKGSIVKGYSRQDMYDLFEIRLMLENLAIKRIGKLGIDEALLSDMQGILGKMKNGQDNKKYAELNQLFHMKLIEMCKSDVIKNMYERLGIPLLSFQSMSFLAEGNIAKSITDHEKIISKLENGLFDEVLVDLIAHNAAFQKRVEALVNYPPLKF